MRSAAQVIASSALSLLLAREALADCRRAAPCVDAEPMWQSPSAVRFSTLSDTRSLPAYQLGVGVAFTLRFRPAVLNVPSPSQGGRDVNLVSHAEATALTARWGIGNGMELTALAAGLSQQGAGIKGVTSQSAPPIDSPVLQDPRVGFGYALNTGSRRWGAKLRFEAKLPLGNAVALAGEASFVASPSVAFSFRRGGLFAGLELGARLRNPTDFFGLRLGSQASLAAGIGYELLGPRLAFALELYALPSLIDSGAHASVPAEWLYTTRFAPELFGDFALGAGAGAGLPLGAGVGGANLGFGLPSFRGLVYVRYTPGSERAAP
ncbi:MAG TPA: hypothetical protein VHP33_01015 [Polyangiaceae bacterium]|nr:hypothetical protein [Polyangiaceae bacterium]